ncbi:hypothetical protein [Bizionia myxarmorum]|uniref:Uncharacterized protein n=1 Tax=Bizionia myxarmorum TaxID=291186 RepID=A0A5D0RBQ9_9FLAO|nr:hypothetical protein [Bizionia myxarmorum]TYB78813.1 hypothetical protein ES674_03280 [Bizionia myxarmorum]
MKKVFSIVALTVFMAGNLNAMEVQRSLCEEMAWHGAEVIYVMTGDNIFAGQYLELQLSKCE